MCELSLAERRKIDNFRMLKLPLVVDIMSSVVKITGRDVEAVRLATSLLEEGKLIALPTDTVYGLACDVQNSEAVKALYGAKIRDLKKPVAISVGNHEDIKHWGITNNIPQALLEELLPGPVTVMLERTARLNPNLNPGWNKVGIRIPDCSFVRDVAKSLGRPLALTSANISTQESCLAPEEFKPIWPCLAAIFDGGRLGDSVSSRAGSTIVDLSSAGTFEVIREGSALNETTVILRKYGLTLGWDQLQPKKI